VLTRARRCVIINTESKERTNKERLKKVIVMKNTVLERVKDIKGLDVTVWDNNIELVVVDFEFDDDYNEIELDYDDEAVEALVEWLGNNAISVEEGFTYANYTFAGCTVSFMYASADI
jgi:hypothetical protein